jgi:hypothetical protein
VVTEFKLEHHEGDDVAFPAMGSGWRHVASEVEVFIYVRWTAQTQKAGFSPCKLQWFEHADKPPTDSLGKPYYPANTWVDVLSTRLGDQHRGYQAWKAAMKDCPVKELDKKRGSREVSPHKLFDTPMRLYKPGDATTGRNLFGVVRVRSGCPEGGPAREERWYQIIDPLKTPALEIWPSTSATASPRSLPPGLPK